MAHKAQTFVKEIEKAQTLSELDALRIALLGKKGSLTEEMKNLASLSPEDRKVRGQELNLLKQAFEAAYAQKKQILEIAALNQKLTQETVDVTLPVPEEVQGRVHPISQTIEEVITIFAHMGFYVAEGPDIEDDWHNFEALNTPAHHPARQMQDTFYMKSRHVLRTQTSAVQIRSMLSQGVPIRIIAPGRVYRRDSDMTHTPMFHQVEGLLIDEHTTMAHLKGCLIEFIQTYFELSNVPVRFRPSYFPFTEPSAEVDIGCSRKGGGLKIGTGADWLEILGCGMVHPNVLKACHVDPEKYQGFAFGVGIERLAMLKYGIPDLRSFFDTDIRWLKHYGFLPFDVPSVSGGLSS